MAEKKDPHIAALQQVYAALKDLDTATQRKVMSSANALLGLELESPLRLDQREQPLEQRIASPSSSRPVSIVELLQQKEPGTNSQRIALFAYYREKYENISRFARDDLKAYFAKAREAPAANYDRDFIDAVRKGWVHEDGGDSYLTSKGVEAVESSFEGERKYTVSSKKRAGGKNKKAPRRKKKN